MWPAPSWFCVRCQICTPVLCWGSPDLRFTWCWTLTNPYAWFGPDLVYLYLLNNQCMYLSGRSLGIHTKVSMAQDLLLMHYALPTPIGIILGFMIASWDPSLTLMSSSDEALGFLTEEWVCGTAMYCCGQRADLGRLYFQKYLHQCFGFQMFCHYLYHKR